MSSSYLIKTNKQTPPKVVTSTPQPTRTWAIDHIYDNDEKKLNIDKLITALDTKKAWLRGLDNELGQLSQGYAPNNIKGTDTIRFIHKMAIPIGRKVTYANFVCHLCLLKNEIYRV